MEIAENNNLTSFSSSEHDKILTTPAFNDRVAQTKGGLHIKSLGIDNEV
jgi:hypothetical protein